MTDNRIRDWFHNQIELQKQSALRFTGRHNVLVADSTATSEIVDFDFHAAMFNFANLNTIQIERSDIAEKALVKTAEDGKSNETHVLQEAVKELERIAALGWGRSAM